MQLELQALDADSQRGRGHSLLLLAGLPRLETETTTELESPVTNRRKSHGLWGTRRPSPPEAKAWSGALMAESGQLWLVSHAFYIVR